MRRLDRAARRSVALRHTSALLVASLFSLLLSQPFHGRVALVADGGAPVAVAAGAAASGETPVQAAGHDRHHCVQCHARLRDGAGLRGHFHEGAIRMHGPALALHAEAPDRPVAAPEPGVAGPRAPPVRLPALHS